MPAESVSFVSQQKRFYINEFSKPDKLTLQQEWGWRTLYIRFYNDFPNK